MNSIGDIEDVREIIGWPLSGDCPHCHTKKVALRIRDGARWGEDRFDMFAQCGHCNRGVIATFSISTDSPIANALKHTLFSGIAPTEMFPVWLPPSAPPHTPDNVARYFVQGMDNIQSENWDAAGAMFRETLESAIKNKFPSLSGTLFSRIDEAAKQHALTPDLAKWAHHIRLEGNKAVHDTGPYEEEDAKSLAAFTEMVLRYLFTLPGMVQEKKQLTGQQP